MHNLLEISDDEVVRRTISLTKQEDWKIFEEFIRRNRERLLSELVASQDTPTIDRIRGRIKSFDFILALSQ